MLDGILLPSAVVGRGYWVTSKEICKRVAPSTYKGATFYALEVPRKIYIKTPRNNW
jgi:hypothetical protein